MAKIVGNDISKYQGDIDYGVYKNNTNFVIIKVSEGVGFQDPKFVRNRKEAREKGIPIGWYHFCRPDLGNSPEAEAQYYLDTIGQLQDGELLLLDYEPNPRLPLHVPWCKRWLDYVTQKTGCKPLIYMSESVIAEFDWKSVADAGYGLWIAKYANPNSPDAAFNDGEWPFTAMYQWTSTQKVPGIAGPVDGDVFFGDVATFKKYGYKAPVAPPATDWEKKYNEEHAAFEAYKKQYNQSNQDAAVASAVKTLNDRIDAAQKG